MTTWAAVIIASAPREFLIRDVILPAVLAAHPDETIVVGSYASGTQSHLGWDYLPVQPLTQTTVDALVKRDVATLHATSELIAYFCDDHKPALDFGTAVKHLDTMAADVWVPARYASQDGHLGERLNNGESQGYCGGHAGVYKRAVIQAMPWTTGPYHPSWDLFISQAHRAAGVRYAFTDQLRVYDCEPGAAPWT